MTTNNVNAVTAREHLDLFRSINERINVQGTDTPASVRGRQAAQQVLQRINAALSTWSANPAAEVAGARQVIIPNALSRTFAAIELELPQEATEAMLAEPRGRNAFMTAYVAELDRYQAGPLGTGGPVQIHTSNDRGYVLVGEALNEKLHSTSGGIRASDVQGNYRQAGGVNPKFPGIPGLTV